MKLSTLNKGLILHLPLNQSSFNPATYRFTDKSGYCFHWTGSGTTLGGTPSFQNDEKGQANQAVAFNGTDDKITIAYNSLFDTTTLTIAGWIYFNTSDGRVKYVLIKRTTNINTPWMFYISTSELVRFTYTNTVPTWYDITLLNMASGYATGWYHIVLQINNASNYYFYFNGEAISDGSIIGTLCSNAEGLTCGGDFGGVYFGTQYLRDVRLYNRVLSATEIKLLYDSYKPQTKISTGGQTLLVTP